MYLCKDCLELWLDTNIKLCIIYLIIEGNYEADILFAFCGECQEFEDKLPADIKEMLRFDRNNKHGILADAGLIDGNLEHFPYIPISEQDYPPLLVGLLSQLATYTLLSEKDVLESWFVR